MKKLMIGLLCFALIAVGVTFGCIQYTLHRREPEQTAWEPGIDLQGYYDENDIFITAMRDPVIFNEGDGYPSISGLKNKTVEDQINADILAHVQALADGYAARGAAMEYLNYYVYGNFANVLSFTLTSSSDSADFDRTYLNYNLNDGSLLKLEDLFCAQADVRAIVCSAFYDMAAKDAAYESVWGEVVSPDESKVYRTAKAYLDGKTQDFSFTAGEIFLNYGDQTAIINMTDHADNIAVYHRFLNEESLYERDDIAHHGIFTCAVITQGDRQRKLGYGAQNFWFDIAEYAPYVDETFSEAVQTEFVGFCDRCFADLETQVDTVRQLAEANPDLGYVLICRPYISLYAPGERKDGDWIFTPSKVAFATECYYLYEMPAELFASKYMPMVRDGYRQSPYYVLNGGLNEYFNPEEVEITALDSSRCFDYRTGAELTVADLFVSGYDYAAALRDYARNELVNGHGFTDEDALAQTQRSWYELDGGGIRAYIPEWGDTQGIFVLLDQFPKEKLTIFE